MLRCNRVRGRHTAENIHCWFEEVISGFDISEKVKHIITDSASKVKKAFTTVTLPGYEEDNDEDGDLSDEEDEDDFEPVSISSLGELFFEHHACFSHTLQLVIKDGMKKAGQIQSVIKRCSKLVSSV